MGELRGSSTYFKLFRITAVCGLLLFVLRGDKPVEKVEPDPQTSSELHQFREADDLENWIYTLIQWAAEKPSQNIQAFDEASAGIWRRPNTPEEIQAWLDLLVNRGYMWLVTGDIVSSTAAYNDAFEWARNHPEIADDRLVLESILKPLGNNYTRLGDYEQALFVHRKALQVEEYLGDHAAMGGTLSNMANAAAGMGNPELALDFCRKGIRLAGTIPSLKGLLLSECADAYAQLGKTDSAKISIRQSIKLLEPFSEDGQAGFWLLMAYQVAGDIFADSFRLAGAYLNKAYQLEKTLLQKFGNLRTRERAKLYYRLTNHSYRQHRYSESNDWADSCLSLLIPGKDFRDLEKNNLFGENTLMDLLFIKAAMVADAGHYEEALRLYGLCFDTEIKLRHEYISTAAREKLIADARARYEQAIALAWKAYVSSGNSDYRYSMLNFIERSKAQLLLEDMMEEEKFRSQRPENDSSYHRINLLEKALVYYDKELQQKDTNDVDREALIRLHKQTAWELSKLKKAYRPELSEDLVQPDSIAGLAIPGQRFRSYFAGEKAVYMVETDTGGIRLAACVEIDEKWKQKFKRFTETYFDNGPEKILNSPDAYCRDAAEIFRLYFGEHPPDTGLHYILLPDGILNRIPVEVLLTKDVETGTMPGKWPYVLQQHLISYAYSFQTYRNQKFQRSSGKGFTGFFVTQTRDLEPLESVILEKEFIQKAIGSGTWMIDSMATTEAFSDALGKRSIVHVSTHASSQNDSIRSPRIEFYNAPFYMFEWKVLSGHPDMVVLSACQSGDGRLVEGEGVLSLARAFTAGGTNAVVAALWNVNDEAAAHIMKSYYHNLIQSVPAAEALRRSKLDWLSNNTVADVYKLPYYWAAMNYHGNPFPVLSNSFENIGPFKKYLWLSISAILVAAVASFLALRRSAFRISR